MEFLQQLRRYGETDRIAFRYGDKTMTFAQLDAWSDAFAAWLLKTFGDDRTPILLYGHKELCLPVCMFGAIKAGRGYVPVDTTFPAERVAQILAQVQPKVMVDLRCLGLDAPVVLDEAKLRPIFETPAPATPETWVRPEDVAYMLFTSGSTGQPKGVQITAGNIAAFLEGVAPLLALEQDGGVFLNEISYSFDVSVCALYYGLGHGMTLYTVDKETLNHTPALFEALRESGIDLWVSTPSLGEICMQSPQFDETLLPNTKKFIFCGEVMTCKLGQQMLRRFPRARIYNAYGPTEATVLVTAVEVTPALLEGAASLPIGYGFSNVECRIENPETGVILPEGEEGELVLLGESVSPGYFQRPEQNARAFFVEHGRRGYHTGDLCRMEGGMVYYFGRLDGQIKLNGFRVELEDVEQNLLKLPNIARAAVLPVTIDGTVQSLTAFVMLEKPDGLSSLQRARQIKAALGNLLPVYMIPRKILVVDAFPLNTNGKIDKKALSAKL